MAQCIVVDMAASGALYASSADPCTTLLALSPAEFAALNNSPLNLSPEDGALLSAAIVGVWCVAWSVKALVRALNVDGEVTE